MMVARGGWCCLELRSQLMIPPRQAVVAAQLELEPHDPRQAVVAAQELELEPHDPSSEF